MTTRAYLRVSSQVQASEGHSLKAQRVKASAWATYQGLPEPIFYEDAGISGRRDDRPQLLSLIEDLQPGDTVIVYALSRLGRGGAVQLLGIVRDIEARGARLVSLTENIDTVTPAGRLLLTILAALTEMELEVTKERITAGRENAASRGLWPHAAVNLPSGWTRAPGGEIVEDPEQADMVRQIFAWAAEDTSTYAIHQRLRAAGRLSVRGKVLPEQSIRRMLMNEAYHTGEYMYRRNASPDQPSRWIPLPGPPLVSEAQWHAAQRPGRGNPGIRRPDVYPLSGHLRCACGGPLNGGHHVLKHGPVYRYGCRPGTRGTPRCPASGKATTSHLCSDVMAGSRAALVAALTSPAAMTALSAVGRADDPHRAERATLERRRDALIDLHLEAMIDRAEFVRRRDELQARIAALQPRAAQVPELTQARAYAEAVPLLGDAEYVELLKELRVRFQVAVDGGVSVLEMTVPSRV